MAYAEVKTRPGIEGTIDKIALIDAMADRLRAAATLEKFLRSFAIP